MFIVQAMTSRTQKLLEGVGRGVALAMSFSKALVSSTEATMRRIYRFVGLDAETIQLPSRLNVQPEDVMELVVSKVTSMHFGRVQFLGKTWLFMLNWNQNGTHFCQGCCSTQQLWASRLWPRQPSNAPSQNQFFCARRTRVPTPQDLMNPHSKAEIDCTDRQGRLPRPSGE